MWTGQSQFESGWARKGSGAKLYHTRIYSGTALTLSQIRAGTSANGTQVAQSLMWWTGYGDLTRARDVKNGNQNQCFTYDSVGRLTVAYTTNNTGGCNGSAVAGNGRYHYTYQYEDNGNIDQVTDHLTSTTHQYTYGAGAAGPHAVTSMGSTTYLYDANGNQTRRGSDVLTWDASNRLTKYDPPGAGNDTEFVYDADGTRIVRLDPDGTATTTLGGVYEHVQGGTPIERVTYRFAGHTVAVRTIQGASNTSDWVVTDHLGSTTVTRDATSAATVRQWYNPYGAQRANTGGTLPTDETYTGQTNDASTGLMHYNARYYDPTLRRFISADTIIPNPSDPADLNRYTYVRNNPLIYMDPTGHWCVLGENPDGSCRGSGVVDAAADLVTDVAETVTSAADTAWDAGWELGEYAVDRVTDEFVDIVLEFDVGDVTELATQPIEELVNTFGVVSGVLAGGDVIAGGGGDTRCPAANSTCVVNADRTLFGFRGGQTFNEVIVTTKTSSQDTTEFHEPQHFYDADQYGYVPYAASYLLNGVVRSIQGDFFYRDNYFERRGRAASNQQRRQDPWKWTNVFK